ncbi:hypothetical protein HID58_072272 [Brassica napus]|uniref:Glucosyltransferase 24 catalytic domain-containing protein n=1 Tax=Brassica napus TaxID=3708 RepID=A0ABQ7Z3Y0_BRANA|nr:hypothetical protein HID58_072272 [Brassica napus]
MATARTIDLCNNPMTKEPKLQGARRIVTENGPILLSRHENSQQKSWVKIWNSTSLSLLRQKILSPNPSPSRDISEDSEQDLESKAEL